MNIALYGFMGSGKSSLGKALASKLNYTFFDLDEAIEMHEAKSISDIFEEEGEITFRKIEHEVLKNFIKKDKKNVVLSLGGGAILSPTNRKLLEIRQFTNVFLNVDIQQLILRLKNDKENRPLLKNLSKTDLEKYITALYVSRKEIYHKYANIKVPIQKENFEDTLEKLYLFLNMN